MPSGFLGKAVILGIGVVLESNNPEALNAALVAFPSRSGNAVTVPSRPVYIVLTVDHDTDTPTRENRILGKRLHITDSGIRVQADGERGRANCSFRIDVIGSELFRETVVTAALFLATQQGRIPVHASALVMSDCAVVLAGRSGSGKSTLALAGDRAGLPVLAEDTVFVQLDPTFRIWGSVDHIHVFEKDAPPGTIAQTRLRAGRVKFALPVYDAPQWADKAALCVIARGDRVSLNPLSVGNAVHALTRDPEPGYDLFATELEEALRAVAAGGCWQLTLSHDPDAAMAILIDAFNTKAEWHVG